MQGYIFWQFGTIFVQIEKQEEFEELHNKGRERGVKKTTEKMIKHTLKYLYEA